MQEDFLLLASILTAMAPWAVAALILHRKAHKRSAEKGRTMTHDRPWLPHVLVWSLAAIGLVALASLFW
jgi:hypothetical protein